MPKNVLTKTATSRRASEEIPVNLTIAFKNRVKNVKLTINPRMIPRGLCFPPAIPPDRTIGNIGKIQGERIVTIPPKNAKRIRSDM